MMNLIECLVHVNWDKKEKGEKEMGEIFGYCRVSSAGQNEDRQLIAMREVNVPERNIFVDKQSGKDFERPQYKRLMKKLKEGDLIYVKSIDSLGRNYQEIMEQWRIITKEKGADMCVLELPLLDTRRDKNLLGTFISDLVLALLSYVAENERNGIRQRQAEGIAAAKMRGVRFGREPIQLPENFEKVCQKWKLGQISVTEAAKECGMAQTTFYVKAKAQETEGMKKE